MIYREYVDKRFTEIGGYLQTAKDFNDVNLSIRNSCTVMLRLAELALVASECGVSSPADVLRQFAGELCDTDKVERYLGRYLVEAYEIYDNPPDYVTVDAAKLQYARAQVFYGMIEKYVYKAVESIYGGTAIITSIENEIQFMYGGKIIAFVVSEQLRSILSVKDWGGEVLTVDMDYACDDKPVEDYIDMADTVSNLNIDPEEYLNPIKKVRIDYNIPVRRLCSDKEVEVCV